MISIINLFLHNSKNTFFYTILAEKELNMIENPQKITFDWLIRFLFTVLIIFGLFWLITRLQSSLTPFAIACLVAYLINPLVVFFQKKCRIKNRILAICTSVVSISIILGLAGWMIIPMITDEMIKMGELLQKYIDGHYVENMLPPQIETYLKSFVKKTELSSLLTADTLSTAGEKIIPAIGQFFTGSVTVLMSFFSLIVIILYLFFILADYDKIMIGWKNWLPPSYKETVLELFDDLQEGMNNYFRAQALVAFIVGILFAIGFSIIGLPLGILLGLLIGALNMVPYLQLAGFLPAIFCALLRSLETGQNFWMVMLFVLIVFAVVQLIQEAILTPKIMGDVTGLNPAVIMLSLSIWGSLMGILGMLIALPVTTIILAYYKRLILKKSQSEAPVIIDAETNDT